jgi:hypothetical protein
MSNLSTSTAHQRDRIIDYSQSVACELNRFTSDRELNVCHLGARIKELKQLGWIFSTVRKPSYDLFGRLHANVAHYTLKGYAKPEQEVEA